jgi:multidrug transporter EmrE-like cation transporter
MNYTTLLVVTSIIALIPIFLIKKYINTKNNNYLYIACVFYLLLLLSYIKVFSQREMSSSYIILQIIQILIIVIGGILLFKEKISLNKLIGIFAGFASIYFINKQ